MHRAISNILINQYQTTPENIACLFLFKVLAVKDYFYRANSACDVIKTNVNQIKLDGQFHNPPKGTLMKVMFQVQVKS